MKSAIPTSLLLAATLFVSSCMPGKDGKSKEEPDLQTVTINDEYSMGIPKNMSKAKSLNDDASLQYQNMFKETYVVVIDENKQEFIDAYTGIEQYDSARTALENYADTQFQMTTANMEVLGTEEMSPLQINGLKAITTQIDGQVENVKFPISYFVTYIDGNEKLYMIMAWTLKDKKETNRPVFEQMAKSFKVIGTTPVASR